MAAAMARAGPSSRTLAPSTAAAAAYRAAPAAPSAAAPSLLGAVPAAKKKPAATAAAAAGGAPSPTKKRAPRSGKPVMPTCPPVVLDENRTEWVPKAVLGQGGFARVFHMLGPNGEEKAFKCINKDAVKDSKSTRAKLLAEIMIHKSMNHPNIVGFEEAFEDEANVYFRLELCSGGSMNDILKRRGAYSEPETRFFMIQILAGCQNMHINSVIHRDLKLGNIFLDSGMNVKIGDFGLAALLKFREERKKTKCGTPNYIAPEVIEDPNHEGHSFEVDVWSVGVILYTLLVGSTPFQMKEVDLIYEKIKTNKYSIPDSARISQEGRELIKKILAHNPAERPTLIEIMNDPWFTCGPVPPYVPASATAGTPHDMPLSRHREDWVRNFETIKRASGFRDDADDEAEEEEGGAVRRSAREERREQEKVEEERERLNKEVKKAVQPGSPISALLRTARQPLLKAAAQGGASGQRGAQPATASSTTSLARQLSALNIGRQQAAAAAHGGGKLPVSDSGRGADAFGDKENAGRREMAPPMAPRSRSNTLGTQQQADSAALGADERRVLGQKARLVAGMTATAGSAVSLASSAESVRRSEDVQQLRRRAELSPFDLMLHNVSTALRCLDQDEAFVPCDAEGNEIEVPVFEADEPEGVRRPANPSTFIICWLDYQEKFGLGYALSDGTVGALFRDSSTMVYNYARSHVDYIYAAKTRSGRAELKKDSRPIMSADEIVQPGGDREAKQRFKIMAHFESHITERLMGADHPLLRPDRETTSGMTFVHKWNRFSHAIVFRLSNGVYQLNFFDHLKLFISHNGLVISAIEPAPADHDGDHVPILRSYTLADLVAIAHSSRATREAQAAQDAASQGVACPLARTRPGERRFARTLVRKLRYAHEILMQPNALGSGRRLASQAQLAQE